MWLFLIKTGDKNSSAEFNDGSKVLIGRGKDNDICVHDKLASRKHCHVQITGDTMILFDLDSKHGTFVNGQKIDQAKDLVSGDQITIGQSEIKVLCEAE